MAKDVPGDGQPQAGLDEAGALLAMPRTQRAAAGGLKPPPLRPTVSEEQDPDPQPSRVREPAQPMSAGQIPGLDSLALSLPGRNQKLPMAGLIWFAVAVILPLLIGIVYFGLIASKQYVAEFHFTIRQPIADTQVQTNQGANGNLSAILGRSASNSDQSDTLDNYTVIDYITSPQAARDIDQRLGLRAIYGRQGVDPFSRFNAKKPEERLERYWRRMVYSTYDPATGLAVVKVRAFSPEDAYSIANNLIDLSNDVVNSIGRHSRSDSVRYAQMEVDQYQRRITEVRARLAALRTQSGVVDPSKSSVPENVTLSDTLRGNLTDMETRYAYLIGQIHNPAAPQIAQLKGQISATQAQLAAIDAQVARDKNGRALTTTVGEFEQLDDERQAVESALFTALGNLQQAVSGADSQRLYMTTYVKPVVPQSSVYPNRLAAIGLVLLVSLMVWLIGVLVAKSVMEHGR